MRISDWSSTCARPIFATDRHRPVAAGATERRTARLLRTPPWPEFHTGGTRAHGQPAGVGPGHLGPVRKRCAVEPAFQIGRESCRERGCQYVEIPGVGVSVKKKK